MKQISTPEDDVKYPYGHPESDTVWSWRAVSPAGPDETVIADLGPRMPSGVTGHQMSLTGGRWTQCGWVLTAACVNTVFKYDSNLSCGVYLNYLTMKKMLLMTYRCWFSSEYCWMASYFSLQPTLRLVLVLGRRGRARPLWSGMQHLEVVEQDILKDDPSVPAVDDRIHDFL